jgi:arylsulfatase A-like enzyme
MPTLLGLADAPPVGGIHGRDLRLLLRGEAQSSQPVYSERVGQQYAVRTREWKLIAGPGDHRELYALRRDPGEQHNLADAHHGQAAALEQVLQRMVASAVRVGRRVTGAPSPVNDATIRRLKALGYVQP